MLASRSFFIYEIFNRMQPTSDSSAAAPLFSTGKKIVLLGGLIIWISFFFPWFSLITVRGPQIDLWKFSFELVPYSATLPSGAEIPCNLGWLILCMAFLIIILPDSFPEVGLRWLRVICLCAFAIGAAALIYLRSLNPAGIGPGMVCTTAGYILLLPGILMDFASESLRSSLNPET